MPDEFIFENVVQHYGLAPKQQRLVGRHNVRRWIGGLIGTGRKWQYIYQPGDCLLLRAAERTRAGSINFQCAPNGELICFQAPVPLTGYEYLEAGIIFPEAQKRGLFIYPPGEYQDMYIDIPFLTGQAGQPVVVEFIEPVSLVSLAVIPTMPYLLHVFREHEENVVTYRNLRVPVDFYSDRADIRQVVFGHALPLIAIEEIYFER